MVMLPAWPIAPGIAAAKVVWPPVAEFTSISVSSSIHPITSTSVITDKFINISTDIVYDMVNMHGNRGYRNHGERPAPGSHGHGFGMRRGEFRFLVLLVLSERPMHGYALIQEIGKFYGRPVSPGIVYPTLQELSDGGFLESREEAGKKVYSISADGNKLLDMNSEIRERLE